MPTLAALPAIDDTRFYEERDVPRGKVEVVHYTNWAGAEKRMHVYLPPGYDNAGLVRYPVLYLNHGGGDDDSKWTNTDPKNGGHAHRILDNLIAEKRAKPMIVVMPNTRGLASPQPPPVDEDDACTKEFLKDILPIIDGRYRTHADRDHRALAGLSMGGFVVMHTGLSRLDTFGRRLRSCFRSLRRRRVDKRAVCQAAEVGAGDVDAGGGTWARTSSRAARWHR
ncbi:MAG: hypothetical protein L6Q38_06280 [Nitrospira sp.]|nr:hypothetical protein [Nitrospira sp.]